MRCTMNKQDFNALIGNVKAFVSKNYDKPAAQLVKLEFKLPNKVTAIACDGFSLSVEHSICKGLDESFACFVNPKVKVKSEIIEIELADGRLLITDGYDIIGFVQPLKVDDFVNHEEVLKNATKAPIVFKIGVRPSFLIKVLKSIKGDMPAVLEFRGEILPIFINDGENAKMVLPLRING